MAICDVLIGFQNITYVHKSRNALGSFDFPYLCSIQQKASALRCLFLVIDHRWGQNVARTKKWHIGAAGCATNVLTTVWRLLWSITEQTHNNTESFYFVWYQGKILLMVTSSIRLSFNSSQLRTNQNMCTTQLCILVPFQLKIQFPTICHHVSSIHASVFQAFVARNFTCEPHL